ncbi:MAG: hypothetical protein HGB35_00290 [Geobacteraceae bacterium]|nr:hypothetical protein [Geobacteraceae bacterium]
MVTGQKYHDGRFSGSLTCDLETLSPLFIPDTDTPGGVTVPMDAPALAECRLVATFSEEEIGVFLATITDPGLRTEVEAGMVQALTGRELPLKDLSWSQWERLGDDVQQRLITQAGHRSERFHRINGEIMLPGSSLRGMILGVHQILTNSCYRNLKEDEEVTRRMAADEAKAVDYEADAAVVAAGTSGAARPGRRGGRVVRGEDGRLYLEEAEIYRLPLYDDMNNPATLPVVNGQNDTVPVFNALVNDTAKASRGAISFDMLRGCSQITPDPKPLRNPKDRIAGISATSQTNQVGHYLKFTGMNVCAKSWEMPQDCLCRVNPGHVCTYRQLDPAWDPLQLDMLLDESCPVVRSKGARSSFRCQGKDGAWYTLTKRCERIFKVLPNVAPHPIPLREERCYRELIASYRENIDPIPEPFRTVFFHEELSENDLVYFELAWNSDVGGYQAVKLTPVCISRTTDPTPMGGKLLWKHQGLLSCVADCQTECAECTRESFCAFHRRHHGQLCPTCSLAGTTANRGRIRVGNGRLLDPAQWYRSAPSEAEEGLGVTLPLLERPRRTWPLATARMPLLGQAVYVNHPLPVQLPATVPPTANNRTVQPLGAGNRFRFQVVFENLAEWELGQLLRSLELVSGAAHRLGRGRPLGMGSVQLRVSDLRCRVPGQDSLQSRLAEKNDFLQAGDVMLAEWFEKPWHEIRHVRELFRALTIPDWAEGGVAATDPPVIRYPGLEGQDGLPGYRDIRARLSPLCPDGRYRLRPRVNPREWVRMQEPFLPWAGGNAADERRATTAAASLRALVAPPRIAEQLFTFREICQGCPAGRKRGCGAKLD